MSKNTTKMLVPKLRFPEFRDIGDWGKQKTSDILVRVSNPVKVDLKKSYQQIGIRSHGKGIFFKDSVIGKALGNKRVFWVEEDAFIVNIVFAWELAIASTTSEHKGTIASHRFPMYKPKSNKSDIRYMKYFFLTHKGKELLWIASPGGAGRNKTLGQKYFEHLEFLAPGVEEQQKIADCLSSIDELITAHSQKHQALKAHKKGLMQQLFPAIGETVPKLRFPEFDEDLKTVGFTELGEIKIGLTHKPNYIKYGKPFLSSKNISKGYIDFENIKYISEEKFSSMPESTKPKVGDILFTRVGSNLGNPIILEEGREFGIFVSLGIFRANKKVSNYYIKHWMDSDYFWVQVKQKVAGGAKDNLNTTWLKEFKLSIPLFSEQQKIANCLSSIDELITTQAQKIELLKAHKKGLMQQLFPAADEVNG